MKRKTKTVSPIRKFYRWKYSGLIVVPLACVLIVGAWTYYTSTLEFFDTWSCETLKNYVQDINVPDDIIPHNELTEEQHMHLHDILMPCLEGDFSNITS